MFSSRLPASLEPNALARAAAARRQAGLRMLDLTQSNPTAVGLALPPDLLAPLADPRALRYAPAPLGRDEARAAVAAAVRSRTPVAPDRVVLTASTSEAYAILFKLLCDPGDAVAVPQPSYPLFDLLTRLEGVAARPYRLAWDGAWWIDRDSLARAAGPGTRAVLVVAPNNPTGSLVRAGDRDWLVDLAAARGLALISDEVFADYPLAPRPDGCTLGGETRALTFALGGLSKRAGLPQVKLAWIAVSGPDEAVAAAMARLEVISDTYLSVSTPVEVAAARLLESGRALAGAIRGRVGRNLARLREDLVRYPAASLLEPEGGWSAVVRVPAGRGEEALALALVERAGVLVHPGYFFDFAHEAFIVLSLLPDPAEFDEALDRLWPIVDAEAAP